MKHDGVSYRFTFKELMYFWFSKKKCPQCKNKMIKNKTYETKKGRDLNSSSDPFFVPQANIKSYKYFYTCPNCNQTYSLNELAYKQKNQ